MRLTHLYLTTIQYSAANDSVDERGLYRDVVLERKSWVVVMMLVRCSEA